MNPARRLVVLLACLLAAAGGVVEQRYLAPQRAELAALGAEFAQHDAAIRRARQQLADLRQQHADLDREIDATRAATAVAEAGSLMKLWSGRIALLKRLLEEMPAQATPELRLLTATDWVQTVRTRELDSPAAIRTAFAVLRATARRKFGANLQEALRRFTTDTQGELPHDIRQLAPYLAAPADLEMLQRYSLLRTGRLGASDEHLIRESAPGDLILSVSLDGWYISNNHDWQPPHDEEESATFARLSAAIQASLADADGSDFLAPFLQISAFQEMLQKLEPQMEALFGEDFGTLIKSAVKRFAADHAGAPPAHFGDLLPYFNELQQIVHLAKPLVAELEYMRDHGGERATDPAQLRRYLEKPIEAMQLLREFKLTVDGDSVTMNFSVSHSSRSEETRP